MKKMGYESGFWRKFLRLSSDGWSSDFESVDRLLEHLRCKTRSAVSRDGYCYNLWVICVWVTFHVKHLPSEEKVTQHMEGKPDRGSSNQRKRWMEIAESLNFDIINPDQLVSMAKENPDQIARLIRKLAIEYNESDSFRYANHILALADTFFKKNKVDLSFEYFSMRGCSRDRKRQEHVPTLAEALKMADVAGSLRNRLIILFMIYTGLRNSTLRALVYNEEYQNPHYLDQTIKKQLQRGEKCLVVIVDKVMKKRVPGACKNNISYYTFIPPKVTEYLILYLRELEEKYGPLRDDQPIFHTENRRLPLAQRLMTPISERELQVIVKDAARKAGIPEWKIVYPHCLRKTFDNYFLRDQPEDVRLDVKDREILMGHKLPGVQDEYYWANIEELRQKYARMNFEPVMRVEKEERVITEDELQSFLQQGWHFEATLPSGKVVVWRKAVITRTSTGTPQPVLEKRENQSSTPQPKQENTKKEEKPSKSLESETETFKKEKESLTTDHSSLISYSSTQQKITPNNDDARTAGFNIPAKKSTKHKQTSILHYTK